MSSFRIAFAASGLALALGGCMGTENRGMESVHQAVVDRQDYAIDLGISGGELAPGEQGRLNGWFETMRLGYGDRVAVDDPQGRNRGVRSEVGGIVAGYGLLLSDKAPVTAAPVAPGTVRVVVSRMRASVPGCPDWSRNSSLDFEAHTSSNFGCAGNTNLAAMVADPSDLVSGHQSAAAADPTVSGKAIATHRKAPPTGEAGLPGGVTSVSVVKGSK